MITLQLWSKGTLRKLHETTAIGIAIQGTVFLELLERAQTLDPLNVCMLVCWNALDCNGLERLATVPRRVGLV